MDARALGQWVQDKRDNDVDSLIVKNVKPFNRRSVLPRHLALGLSVAHLADLEASLATAVCTDVVPHHWPQALVQQQMHSLVNGVHNEGDGPQAEHGGQCLVEQLQ